MNKKMHYSHSWLINVSFGILKLRPCRDLGQALLGLCHDHAKNLCLISEHLYSRLYER